MAQFPRPENTITDLKTIKLGDEVWEVYGIWCPSIWGWGPKIITQAPILFKDHPEYKDIHKSQKDLYVFELDNTLCFLSDRNLDPVGSHNDNYLTRSKEDAEAAQQFLQNCLKANPGAIEEELEDICYGEDIDYGGENYEYGI